MIVEIQAERCQPIVNENASLDREGETRNGMDRYDEEWEKWWREEGDLPIGVNYPFTIYSNESHTISYAN